LTTALRDGVLVEKNVTTKLSNVTFEVRDIRAGLENHNEVLASPWELALDSCVYQSADVPLLDVVDVEDTS
jgi:hypothetical protein